ncbi:MAG: hypothetical protein AAF354_13420, partial [Pseudomonadota bacterium]
MANTANLNTVLAFASAMLASGLAATPAAATQYCHNYVVTGDHASGATLSAAKERARRKWSEKAVAVYTTRGGNWTIASDKEYQCGRAGIFYCQARAVPCLNRAKANGPKS